MNSVVKAVLVGAVAGAFHMFIMLAKDVSNYSIAAIVIQYIIASVVIFHVPLKITGWKKGLAVAVFSALPLAIFIPRYEKSASYISASIMMFFFGIVIGMYGSRDEEPFPRARVIRGAAAGAITGAIHAGVMFLKGAAFYAMIAVNLQYVIASLLIFFLPVKLTGWVKGLIIGELASLPLAILIPHYDPAGSTIAGFILSAIAGSLVGVYSSNKEKP
jgi:hypothetical protein